MKRSFWYWFILACSSLACRPSHPPVPPSTIARSTCDSLLTIQALQGALDAVDQEVLPADGLWEKYRLLLADSTGCGGAAADSLRAETARRLGNLYLGQSLFSSARSCFEAGIAARHRQGNPVHRQLLRLLHNTGLTYFGENDLHTALLYFKAADVDTLDSKFVPYALNLMALGRVYLQWRDFRTAQTYFEQARKRMDQDTKGLTGAWSPDLWVLYSDGFRLAKNYRRAIDAALFGLKDPYCYPDQIANCYLNLGNAWQDSMQSCPPGQFRQEASQQAIEFTTKALHLYDSLKIYKKASVDATLNLGEIYRRTGAPKKAADLLSQAISQRPNVPAPDRQMASLYLNRGEAYFDQGNLPAALDDYYLSLHFLVPDYPPGNTHPLPSLESYIVNRARLLLLFSDLGQAHLARYAKNGQSAELDRAGAICEKLLELLNRIRGDYLGEGAKLDLAADSQDYLHKAFAVCRTLYNTMPNQQNLERAFRVSEQSKAFALLEAVQLNNLHQTLPVALQQQERSLTRRRALLDQEQGLAKGDKPTLDRLQKDWLDLQEEGRKFQDTLRIRQSRYFAMKYAGPRITIDSLQRQLLAPDQGLIEYFYSDSTLDIFLITPHQSTLKTIHVPPAFAALVDSVRWMIKDSLPLGTDRTVQETALGQKGYRLYEILLAPLAAKLPERLVIIPDAPLHELPLEALPDQRPAGSYKELTNQRRLVLFQHSLSYCFSANLWWEMEHRETNPEAAPELAALAPDFPPQFQAGVQPLLPSVQHALRYLKHIHNAEEVLAICDSLPGKVWLNATKDQFWQACQQYAAVHVATHGILDNTDPNFNFIAFHQGNSQINQQELLFLTELYAHPLAVELVVLSACETARGKFRPGEGSISMGRGLAQAGVKSLVTTLWQVEPAYNRAIMPRFYAGLRTPGQAKDRALARAKRQFIIDSPSDYHPASWAGMVLIGASNQLALRPHKSVAGYLWLLIPFALLGLGVFFWQRRR